MNVLIFGVGSIARKHISALRTLCENVHIYAFRRDQTAEQEDGIFNIFSIQEVEKTHFEFAIISNPTSEHIKTINMLSNAKIPLFIEKPLSNKLDIGECLSSCENILTYIACNLRFLDCLTYVKENINNKRINEINVYCGSFLPEWRPHVDWRKVYSANKEMGGGVHIDLIHEIDYIYWFFGKPKGVMKYLRNTSSLGISAIDYANFIFEYELFSVNIVLNYFRRDYKRTLEIVFDTETWLVDLANNTIKCNGNLVFSSVQKMTDTYIEQMKYFLSLLKNNKQVSQNSISDAYNVLKLCLNHESN